MLLNINQLRKIKNLTIKINDDTDLVLKTSNDEQTLEINVVSTNTCCDSSHDKNDVDTCCDVKKTICNVNESKLTEHDWTKTMLGKLRTKSKEEIISSVLGEVKPIVTDKIEKYKKTIDLIDKTKEQIKNDESKILPTLNEFDKLKKMIEEQCEPRPTTTENKQKNPYKIKKIKI